jgi:hypothetical protein
MLAATRLCSNSRTLGHGGTFEIYLDILLDDTRPRARRLAHTIWLLYNRRIKIRCELRYSFLWNRRAVLASLPCNPGNLVPTLPVVFLRSRPYVINVSDLRMMQ